MNIIDGRKIARKIIEELKKLPKPQRKLAAIFVGENPASESFLKQKKKIAEELGIEFTLSKFPGSISQGLLIKEIKKNGADDAIGGVIVQLPLPEKFDRDAVLTAINPQKDIDALSPEAKVEPLAVGVVKDILEEATKYENSTNIRNLKDRIVGVMGRGILVGRPVAEWLSGKCREIIIFHTKTDLSRIKECDLIISGAGKAGLLKPEMLKPGAGVIDFGFDMVDGKIRGDLNIESLVISHSSLSFYTPTPGGTGPILVAELFKNFYSLLGVS